MKRRLTTLLQSRIVRYLITGGLGFVAELIVIAIAVRGLGTSAIVGVGISFWVGILVSFLLQKLFTFRDHRHTPVALTRQSVTYAALVCLNYVFTLAFVAIADPLWSAPELARAVALLITTAWNYAAYRYIIFR